MLSYSIGLDGLGLDGTENVSFSFFMGVTLSLSSFYLMFNIFSFTSLIFMDIFLAEVIVDLPSSSTGLLLRLPRLFLSGGIILKFRYRVSIFFAMIVLD